MTPSHNHRNYKTEEERSSDILVIGDDAVSISIVRYLSRTETVIFIGRANQITDRVDEHAQKTIEVSSIPEFIKEIDIIPNSVIVATSQDSRNLLFVQHLLLEFDMGEIIVRLNAPQNIDAYADLPVAIVDAADIVGSALAQQLGQSSSRP